MTTDTQDSFLTASMREPSTLPFDEQDLLSVRLLPSEFARTIGVSRQAVSQWVKHGKVTLGADGRLDPNRAFRQLLRTGDPGRIRVRLVRQAIADMADLREAAGRTSLLEQQLNDAQRRIKYLEGYSRELDLASEIAPGVLADSISEIRAAEARGGRSELVACFVELLYRALIQAADTQMGDIDFSAIVGRHDSALGEEGEGGGG